MLSARVVSVNRGVVKPFAMARGMRTSAIDKQPVAADVAVGALGLDGDEQADPRFHGGPRKAVYVYAAEDLAWWSAQLNRTLGPGFIGENLTVEGIDLGALRAGDELHVADVILRVTEPRDPCAKLAARVGLPGFERRFGRAHRPGVYCEVARTGTIRSGAAVDVVPAAADGPTIREIVAERYGAGSTG